MLQHGKKDKVDWSEITASCAYKDFLILGFGNGTMANVRIEKSSNIAESISNIDMNFTGEEDLPIDKMRIMTVDTSMPPSPGPAAVAGMESNSIKEIKPSVAGSGGPQT